MTLLTRLEHTWLRLTPRFLRRLGLRARFMVMAAFAITVFGLVNLFVFDALARGVVDSEVQDRARTLATRLSEEAGRLVLLEDRAGARRLLEETRRTDSLCDYALVVLRNGEVFSTTFEGGVPRGLAELVDPTHASLSTRVVSDRGARYLDVSAPLLDGQLGVLRLGARMDRVSAGARRARIVGGVMVAAFLVLGLFGAYFTAHLVAAPVERLAQRVQAFHPDRAREPQDRRLVDEAELGALVRSFDVMAQRLSELHAEEQEFQSRIVRAERLATVGALAAGVAHDVNNPLAGIRNCLKAIDRAPEDVEQTRMYAPLMLEATRSIERAVRGLMDLASRSAPTPEEVELSSLAERTATLVRHRYRRCGCALEVDAPGTLSVRTDPTLVQQVLVNLLLNACEATGEGGEVRCILEPAGQGGARFEVRDTGSGIPEEMRESVFEPFVTTKAESGGTGLGLAMARAVARDLGGDLSYETEVGVGTRFFLVLPGPDADERASLREAS